MKIISIYLFSTVFFFFGLPKVTGQAGNILVGRITDANSGEPLIGATIKADSTDIGTITNEKGYYHLYLKDGKYTLLFSYIGYKPKSLTVNVPLAKKLDVKLEPISLEVSEVVVSAKNPNQNIESTATGMTKLSMKQISRLPALMGETDFLRIIQLTPGIQSANDANMGFNVRGGGTDQNLILFDNVPVYNPSHVLGFFSVFSSDVVRSTKLIKSGMPANYGGRISSVIDISSNTGDYNKYIFKGSLGLLSSKLSIQGPVVKDKLSFLISGRKSYIDELFKPLMNSMVNINSTFYKDTKYNLTDLNLKLSYRLSEKHTISLSAYKGNDVFSLIKTESNFENEMSWGNRLIAANWNYQINSGWNLQSTLGFTGYTFNLKAKQENIEVGLLSKVNDYVYKTILCKSGYNGQIIKIGAEYYFHRFQPNNLDASTNNQALSFGSNRNLDAHEASVFYNHELDITQRLRANLGLRFTYYMHVGPYYKMLKNEIGQISDSVYYKPGKFIDNYFFPEPRISLRYKIDNHSSVKGSYTLNRQYVHMISSSTVTLPTDVWLPSTSLIKPQWGEQFTAGYFRNFPNKNFESSFNIYYKNFHNQIELLQGFVNNFQDNDFEESATFGKGYSLGAEVYLQKSYGRLTGWIAYTLSGSFKKFKEINEGKIYPAKYDRRHDLNVVLSYEFNSKWSASSTFILASGNAFTMPAYKYILEGNVISGYSSKNSFRMPLYHRLDLSLTYLVKKSGDFESSVNFSVYNVYNRANPFYIYFEVTGNVYDYNLNITPQQICVLPILPTITWSFKF